jgi:hypothetical protein
MTAFPAANRAANKYLAWPKPPDTITTDIIDELQDGAFALGGLVLVFQFSAGDAEVVVTNMRLTLATAPPPTGAGILIGTQGNSFSTIGFDTTHLSSQARVVNSANKITNQDYFASHTIVIPAHKSQTVRVVLGTPNVTAVGRLTADLRANGKQSSEVIADKNVVRIGPKVCDSTTGLGNYNLSPVRYMGVNPSDSGYIMKSGPPISMAEKCSVFI